MNPVSFLAFLIAFIASSSCNNRAEESPAKLFPASDTIPESGWHLVDKYSLLEQRPLCFEDYGFVYSQRPEIGKDGNPISSSNLHWKWFTLTKAPCQELVDSVNTFIWEYLTENPFGSEADYDSLEHEYILLSEEGSFGQISQDNDISPMLPTEKTFTVLVYRQGYYGGPPQIDLLMTTFEVGTGKKLILADIVTEPDSVFKVGGRIYRQMNNLPLDYDLEQLGEGGFNRMVLGGESFGVFPSKTGLGLSFYLGHHTELFYIPYDSIKDYLKEDYKYLLGDKK